MDNLPAITARGAPADFGLLKNGDLEPGFSQMKAGRQPGIARADDANVSIHATFERRAIG